MFLRNLHQFEIHQWMRDNRTQFLTLAAELSLHCGIVLSSTQIIKNTIGGGTTRVGKAENSIFLYDNFRICLSLQFVCSFAHFGREWKDPKILDETLR